MKKTTFITLALLCLTTMTMAKKSKTVTLQLVETSDVHGAFFPYNFIERKPMRGTMARVSTYVKTQRKKFGKNLILLANLAPRKIMGIESQGMLLSAVKANEDGSETLRLLTADPIMPDGAEIG